MNLALQHVIKRLVAMRAYAAKKQIRFRAERGQLLQDQLDHLELAGEAHVSGNRYAGEVDAFDRALKVARKALRETT